MKRNNKKGFTIVELVIVIAVIAILAGVLIPTFAGIIKKANISKAQQEAANLYKEVYALDMSDGKLDGKDGKDDADGITAVEGNTTEFTYTVDESGNISFSCEVDKYTVEFDGTDWTVAETPTEDPTEAPAEDPTEAPTETPTGNAG